MMITILGVRGTIPSETSGTVGLVLNSKYAFDVPPDFIQSMIKARIRWTTLIKKGHIPKEFRAYPTPNLRKIEHLFISHFHWDHWGGLGYFLRWLRLFHYEMRKKQPLNVYIPKRSMDPFKRNLIQTWKLAEEKVMSLPDHEFFLKFLSLELHESISEIVQFHTVVPKTPLYFAEDQLQITTEETGHLSKGSLAYKIEKCKENVDMNRIKALGLTPGPIIGKILKSPDGLEINGKKIYKEQIVNKKCVVVSYSGDSPINEELLEFCKHSDILIHDAAYLSAKEEYYLERHADFESLVLFSQKISELKTLVPIHFSYRYEDTEIEETIRMLVDNANLPFNVIVPRASSFILIKKEKIFTV